MSIKSLVLLCACSFIPALSHANNVVAITETDGAVDSISATYNGNTLAITVTGSADAWSITLPTGYNILVNDEFRLAEPENSAMVNRIFVASTGISWSSDISLDETPVGSPYTISNAGFIPATDSAFDLVFSDVLSQTPPNVPDAASTMLLLGTTLVSLGVASARMRATSRTHNFIGLNPLSGPGN